MAELQNFELIETPSFYEGAYIDVAFGNGIFVAITGDLHGCRIVSSTDGINWTRRNDNSEPSDWKGICYGNGLFVVVANYNVNRTHRVAISTNGIDWTEHILSGTYSYDTICYGNDKFVAIGYNGTMYSTDGITWIQQPQTLAIANFTTIVYGNGKFVALTYSLNSNNILYSTNGTSWNAVTLPEGANWNDLAFGNGKFVCVKTGGTNRVVTSPDGINWVVRGQATGGWTTLCFDGTKFIAIGYGGSSQVMTSTDGISWNGNPASIGTDFMHIIGYGNGIYVAFGNTGLYRRATSTNGLNWTSREGRYRPGINSICANGSLLVGINTNIEPNNKRISTSVDGRTWTERVTPSTTNILNSLCYGNGLFVAVGNNLVMTSSDGITWTSRTPAAASGWRAVCYGNGLFVAVSQDGVTSRVMTSTNGTTWISRTSPSSNSWRSVCFGNNLFVAVGLTSSNTDIMTSPDGINWTTRTTPVNNQWRSVVFGNNEFIAVSEQGNIMKSSNGTNWTYVASGVPSLYAITYGNGMYVAVGYNLITTSNIVKSIDGINWTIITTRKAFPLSSIFYYNNEFIATMTTPVGAYGFIAIAKFITLFNKYLIRAGSVLYKVVNNNVEAIQPSPTNPTEQDYITHGFEDLSTIPESYIDQYFANDVITFLNFNNDPAITSRNIKQLYKAKEVIVANGDIDLSSIYKLNGLNITYNRSGTGIIKIAISPDSGVNWFGFDGSNFASTLIDADSLKVNGMTPEVFNNIPEANLMNLIRVVFPNNTLRFAYYLEEGIETDVAETNELELLVEMEGTWEKASHGTEYDYEYTNLTTVKIQLFADGNYKINY